MSLTGVQRRVLEVIAAQRSPDSYVAGGAALNRERPRISEDIDIFHPDEQLVLSLGTLAWAAAAKTASGPGALIENILRNASTHNRREYEDVRSDEPVDGALVIECLIDATEKASALFRELPPKSYGCVLLDGAGGVSEAAAAERAGLRWHAATCRGVWPFFPDRQQELVERVARKSSGNDGAGGRI